MENNILVWLDSNSNALYLPIRKFIDFLGPFVLEEFLEKIETDLVYTGLNSNHVIV